MTYVIRLALLIGILLLSCSSGTLSPTSSSASTVIEPIPFEICGESTTWMRPSEEDQQSKWWSFARYAGGDASIIKYPWTHNFFVNYGSASVEFDLVNLSGLWTLPPDVRKSCLEPNRQQAVARLERAEVWILHYRVKSISHVGANFTIMVEPVEKGVQFIQFNRPDPQIPLTLSFKTEDGQEIEKIVETESVYWPYPNLKPTRER